MNFEEARRITAWAKENKLIFDPLPCEASQKALKQKAVDDIINRDAVIRAKKMSIRYHIRKIEETPEGPERNVYIEGLRLRERELEELETPPWGE